MTYAVGILCNIIIMQACKQHTTLTAASAIGKSSGDIRARMVDNIMNTLMATARRTEEGLTVKLKFQLMLTFCKVEFFSEEYIVCLGRLQQYVIIELL